MSNAVSRRRVLMGVFGLAGIVLLGDLVFEVPRLLTRRYPSTPYDDLLSQLGDRESAARLGKAVLAAEPGFGGGSAAQALRRSPAKGSLRTGIDGDLASGRLIEIHGWLLPQTLVTVSAIAALEQKASPA
jgi:hypothetical protein